MYDNPNPLRAGGRSARTKAAHARLDRASALVSVALGLLAVLILLALVGRPILEALHTLSTTLDGPVQQFLGGVL